MFQRLILFGLIIAIGGIIWKLIEEDETLRERISDAVNDAIDDAGQRLRG